MDISNPRFSVTFLDQMRNRVHQMCLAETNTPIEEQRVVSATWIFRHLQRCGFRELIALALNERAERKVRLESSAYYQAISSSRARNWHRRGDAARGRSRNRSRSYLYRNDWNVTVTLVA